MDAKDTQTTQEARPNDACVYKSEIKRIRPLLVEIENIRFVYSVGVDFAPTSQREKTHEQLLTVLRIFCEMFV